MSLSLKRAGSACMVAFLFIAGLAMVRPARAAELNDLLGDWTAALLIAGAPQLATLNVQKNPAGEGLIATITSALGENKIEDIEVIEGKHHLLYMMDLGGQQTDIEVTAEVVGEKFSGQVVVGGGAMVLDLKGAKTGSEAEKELKAEIEKMQAAAAAPAGGGAPILPIADAQGFVGDWMLTLTTPGGEQKVPFSVKDVEGKAQATLELPPPMEKQTINKITKTDTGLILQFPINFGGQNFDLAMNIKKEGEQVKGSIADPSGVLTMDFTGVAKTAEMKTAAPATSSAPALRPGRGNAELTLNGKKVTISFGRPSTSGPGYKRLEQGVPDGFIWRMGSNNATKLTTDGDLKFGATNIPAGSYSLWAKRAGNTWNLVFNKKPDVWGTNHDPAADFAEVPLEASKSTQPAELMTIELLEENGMGVFRLQWGPDVGTTKFTVAK